MVLVVMTILDRRQKTDRQQIDRQTDRQTDRQAGRTCEGGNESGERWDSTSD